MPVRLLQTNKKDLEIQAMMRSIKYYEKQCRRLNEIISYQAEEIDALKASLEEKCNSGTSN